MKGGKYNKSFHDFSFLGKLLNVKVTSKFFEQTTAAAMFGDEPIKRSNTKLKEREILVKRKLKVR